MSHMVQIGNATVCYEPMEEIHRESLGERWCFRCRKRREFLFIVTRPVDVMSYYGPNPTVRCGRCESIDGDCGFGSARDWEF